MSVPKEVIFLFCFESDWLKASWMTALKDCLQETRERFSDSRWTSAEKSKTLAQQLHESWKMTSASKSGHVLVLFQLPEAGIPEPHSWAIRFVVLSEHHLVCFKNKGAADGSPEEKIALDASCVAVQDSSLGKSFACRITLDSGVRMALAFDSRPIMEGWIEAITRRSAQFTRKDSSSSASNSVSEENNRFIQLLRQRTLRLATNPTPCNTRKMISSPSWNLLTTAGIEDRLVNLVACLTQLRQFDLDKLCMFGWSPRISQRLPQNFLRTKEMYWKSWD
eukprot:TRINITY_DN4489_c0_g1_i3.p1 TRINITY_DN4489_c0_g1~~TRINITY_DN4489_c0_g1_i3.p1  ORF type:complete len:279 (+),score=54.71 TRINITY_DN4489_c0_g1_i3:341-1177(+)